MTFSFDLLDPCHWMIAESSMVCLWILYVDTNVPQVRSNKNNIVINLVIYYRLPILAKITKWSIAVVSYSHHDDSYKQHRFQKSYIQVPRAVSNHW